jgi:hypothetical protein
MNLSITKKENRLALKMLDPSCPLKGQAAHQVFILLFPESSHY